MKRERWGSPLVQEGNYRGEKACGKRTTTTITTDDDDNNNNNNNNNNHE